MDCAMSRVAAPPRAIDDARIETVIGRTLESLPADATHRSSCGMARACSLSVSTVQRIWGLQPHRLESFKLSSDPDFVAKVRDVIGLYVSPSAHAIVNYATHKHPKVRQWLVRHPRWTFHFTPTSASWLNAVEGFFAKLTRQRLKRGVFQTVVDLQVGIDRFVADINANPKPFVWVSSPLLSAGNKR
jgi:hypothetical protein